MRFLQLILAVFFLLSLPACRQLSAALSTQGYHDYQKGDYDRAIRDYDNAIRWDPKSAVAFTGRGSAYLYKGDYDQAIHDFNEAVRLNPKSPRALLNLGIANIYAGHFSESQQDLSQYLDPKDPSSVVWLYLARAKGGTDGKAELKANAAALDLSKWPGPVIELYLGQSTPEDVLHAAGSDSGQRCEYSFYVGEYRALRGERRSGSLSQCQQWMSQGLH